MSLFDQVYRHMPVWAQHTMFSTYGLYWHWLRFGHGYNEHVRAYRTRERFDAGEWAAWQQAQLVQVLSAAADTVPYYQQTWTPAEKRAAHSGRLQDLPLLPKEAVRADPWSLVRQDVRPGKRLVYHTSGSTGTPIASIWTVGEVRSSVALREVRSANWAQVSYTQPRATFHGRLIVPRPDSPGPFHRFNASERQVYLSAFHLRPDTAARYVDALCRHQVRWLTGYAVSFYLLAGYMLEQGLKTPSVKAVITTSEKLTPVMRQTMETAYGCRVYEEYSSVENALFASECECGHLHISPDVALVEILRPDGSACDPGEPGEVVCTSLMRRYQAFVRYRLGDVAAWSADPCPCGRAMPVLKEVVGRIEDAIVAPDGRRVTQFYGVFTSQPHIREAQIVQETVERIRVKVVPAAGFGAADIEDVVTRMKQRLGAQAEIVVEPVDRIPRNRAGKFRAVIPLQQTQGVGDDDGDGPVAGSAGR